MNIRVMSMGINSEEMRCLRMIVELRAESWLEEELLGNSKV